MLSIQVFLFPYFLPTYTTSFCCFIFCFLGSIIITSDLIRFGQVSFLTRERERERELKKVLELCSKNVKKGGGLVFIFNQKVGKRKVYCAIRAHSPQGREKTKKIIKLANSYKLHGCICTFVFIFP